MYNVKAEVMNNPVRALCFSSFFVGVRMSLRCLGASSINANIVANKSLKKIKLVTGTASPMSLTKIPIGPSNTPDIIIASLYLSNVAIL